jgi:hypothetical protein
MHQYSELIHNFMYLFSSLMQYQRAAYALLGLCNETLCNKLDKSTINYQHVNLKCLKCLIVIKGMSFYV